MLVKALKSFSGAVAMSKGTIKDIEDKFVVEDLIRAGYVEPEVQEAEIVKKPVEISEKTSTKKKKSKK